MNPRLIPQPAPISELIGKDFHRTHRAMRSGLYDEFWEAGGRGSLKSSFVAIKILLGMMEDPLANAVAIRKVGDTVGDSIKATFSWSIDMLGWTHFFHIPKALNTITFLPTGQQIVMRGLDDPLKLKSIRPRRGYFKYLWFEEGAEYDSIEEMESVTQSVLRGGPEFLQFVSYNPPVEPKHWINIAAKEGKDRRHFNESCYLNAPPAWLGPKFLADADEMRRKKPDKYANVYLGKSIGRSEAIVFSGCYAIEGFEVTQRRDAHGRPQHYIGETAVEGPYFGADWGFSQDPTVLVKCWYAPKQCRVYIEDERYGAEIPLEKTPKKPRDIEAMFLEIEGSKRYKIRADCSRPETIAHVKDKGFNIEAAEKWSGSIEDGIEWLKGNELIIHDRCEQLQDEAIKYAYKIDRVTRDVLSDLVDKHNHGWDAIRYAFAPMIKPKPKGIFGSGILVQNKQQPAGSSAPRH